MAPGERLDVSGSDPHLQIHLAAWARSEGHALVGPTAVVNGATDQLRLVGSVRAGSPDRVEEHAPSGWGLAARGALVEAGGPELVVADLDTKEEVWSKSAPRLYAQAVASQWDIETAVQWTVPQLPGDVEDAVVQLMTYLIENEQAALMVPARFIGRVHPHFREVAQFLATQVADEARHIEVFARRAVLSGRQLGISSVAGRQSLQTLVEESDWANASFLLSVMGEGTFLSLLAFLERFAPDPVTAQVARLSRQDEARHVSFALGHLAQHSDSDSRLRDRLRAAAERRHDALSHSAGLSPVVHDALVVLASGGWDPASIEAGWARVQKLQIDMDDGRRRRLERLGFSEREAAELSELHTRNFM
jgi:P-aminobenzoate N-oxygenase AurF